jgi:hypothetical protein
MSNRSTTSAGGMSSGISIIALAETSNLAAWIRVATEGQVKTNASRAAGSWIVSAAE